VAKLVASKDPKLFAEIRAQALEPLTEMARWRNPGHARIYQDILKAVEQVP